MKVNDIFIEDLKRLLDEKDKEGRRLWTQTTLANHLGFSQPYMSGIINGCCRNIKEESVTKICDLLNTGIKRYEQTVKIAPTESYKGIYSYQLANGCTYIGKPNNTNLEEACMVPTVEIARLCYRRNIPITKAERQIYDKLRCKDALDIFPDFIPPSSLELITRKHLGEDDN